MSNEQKQPAGISEPGVYVGYLPAMGWCVCFGLWTALSFLPWPYTQALFTGAAATSLLCAFVEVARMVVHGQTTAAAMKRMFDAEREAFANARGE
ncbi:hypothetical protein LCGC14_2354200 [marine sediment metagenome]|uniref:Uncharacterized protein n=1 Tax=marine sediment metagenome TaxID=412755 RepID=A0A0F9C868_9ZZZZ